MPALIPSLRPCPGCGRTVFRLVGDVRVPHEDLCARCLRDRALAWIARKLSGR